MHFLTSQIQTKKFILFGIILILVFASCNCGSSEMGLEYGSINGKAFYSFGNNHSGIIISLEKKDKFGLFTATTDSKGFISVDITNEDGSFAFYDLEPGTYTVYASSDDSVEKTVSTDVTVKSGEIAIPEDLHLTTTGSISGYVTIDGESSGNSGFLVFLPGTSCVAVTGDNGFFCITGVPVGDNYQLSVSKGGYLLDVSVPCSVSNHDVTNVGVINISSREQEGILDPNKYSSEEQIQYFNVFNICPKITLPEKTIHGLTYSADNGLFSFSGTTDGELAVVIVNKNDGSAEALFQPGTKYYVYLSDEALGGLHIQVINNGTALLSTQTSGSFVTPDDLSGLSIRLYVGNGKVVNGKVRPVISNYPTIPEITKLMVEEFSPMLTIIDDDGNNKFYSDILPIITSEKVSISAAIPVGSIGSTNTMTWEQIEECYRCGAEILSHTYNHVTSYSSEKTEHDIELDYTMARNELLSHGIYGGRYLVFSGSTGEDYRAKIAAPYVYNLAINSAGNVMNYANSINMYRIFRYRIQTDGYNYNLEALKELIDACYASNGWMVWMIHTSDASWTETAKLNLIEAIQYAKTIGLPIVSVDYVYQHYLRKMI